MLSFFYRMCGTKGRRGNNTSVVPHAACPIIASSPPKEKTVKETRLDAFWLSFFMIFVAEMGDKTQLVALCLSSRFNAWVVLAGISVATLVVHVFSVLLGGGVGKFLPVGWISLTAALAFIGFGLWTLRGDELEDENCGATPVRSPFWMVTTTFFLAELGDKTMLSTVTLATGHDMIPVWIGSTLGMVASDGLAIIVGQILGKKLPERAIQIGAALIFFAFGIYSGIKAVGELPRYGLVIAALLMLLMLAWYWLQILRDRRNPRRQLAIDPTDSPEQLTP